MTFSDPCRAVLVSNEGGQVAPVQRLDDCDYSVPLDSYSRSLLERVDFDAGMRKAPRTRDRTVVLLLT